MKILEKVLAKRSSLPEKPNSTHLKGQYVKLEPLVLERDAQSLFEMSNGSSKAICFRTSTQPGKK
jgi:hypothetical protein